MDLNPQDQYEADREAAAAYARCMAIGTALAMALIVIECVAYVSGALSPYVPLEDLPRLWGMSMKEYLLAARVPAGWGCARPSVVCGRIPGSSPKRLNCQGSV